MLKKVTRPTLVDGVLKAIRTMLDDPAWTPGMRLPGELELARQLGVGRSTIREALRSLAHLGIVEARSGLGTFVVRSSHDAAASWTTPTRADLIDLYEVRHGLERVAAENAAQRRSDRQLHRIRSAWDASTSAIENDDVHEFARVDFRFHLAIVEAAGNRLLLGTYERLEPQFLAAVSYVLGLGRLDSMRAFHVGLIDAIERRDSKAAAKIVDTDFLHARVRLKLPTV